MLRFNNYKEKIKNMEIIRKIDGGDKVTQIKHNWDGPAAFAGVVMKNSGGGASGAHFALEIEGGQVQVTSNITNNGGILSMFGDMERKDFIELLKQVVIELELIDQK